MGKERSATFLFYEVSVFLLSFFLGVLEDIRSVEVFSVFFFGKISLGRKV